MPYHYIAYSSTHLQDYNAKLSDFGLAKEGPIGDQTHVSTRVMGTYGYAAPEYIMTGESSTNMVQDLSLSLHIYVKCYKEQINI